MNEYEEKEFGLMWGGGFLTILVQYIKVAQSVILS